MGRLVAALLLAFLILMALRALRLALAGPRRPAGSGGDRPLVEGDMTRDPICGAFVDPRAGFAVRRAGQTVLVCSEKCRARLEGS